MSELELESVTKVFDDGDEEVVAVDEVSLAVEDGEFIVVVGPSGCGKSTTLRMVAGLESITSGAIRLGDTVINDTSPQDRDIAMVFQSYALYPHMSVRDNMSFGLEESTDLPDEEIGKLVEDSAGMMGIAELLDRKPSELSGGQQQRVALGRAIVRDPEVFLMDEPLSNLDAKLRSQMRTELQRLQEDLDVTTMYVTHDQTEAMTMGDRIAILDSGRLQQIATPLECYHEPANEFVAGFIGEPSMNFFEMRLESDRLVSDAFVYPLNDDICDAVEGVEDVVLGVRPEAIELVADMTGEHDYETVVDVVEPMGSENIIYLQFEGTAETLVATTSGMRQVRQGSSAAARIPDDAIHVFDAESGKTLHNRTVTDEAFADVPTR